MPLYSYQCNLCGFNDDVIIDTKKRDKKWPCEQEGCSGIMFREFDAPSFHLKGDGWFKDGYSSNKPKPKEEEK